MDKENPKEQSAPMAETLEVSAPQIVTLKIHLSESESKVDFITAEENKLEANKSVSRTVETKKKGQKGLLSNTLLVTDDLGPALQKVSSVHWQDEKEGFKVTRMSSIIQISDHDIARQTSLIEVDENDLQAMIGLISERQKSFKMTINSMAQTISSMVVDDPNLWSFLNSGHQMKCYIPYALLVFCFVLQIAIQISFLDKTLRPFWPKWL